MTAQRPNVLFVDDEENILHGLGRLLRSRRNAWNMRFANSGDQALKLLAEVPADVVVTDMRMPGMTGAELLAIVQKRYPNAVRIVLSGFADREAILKTIGPSHRYLAKPASEEVLVNSIENALQLREFLRDEKLRKTVAGLSHLPVLPLIYTSILAELNSEIGSADRLASIIEGDVGISAQILKLTNSAYFSLPRKSTTIKQSIHVLGFDNIRAAVLLAGVFDQFTGLSNDMIEVIDRLAQRSLAVGILAQAIAMHEGWNAEAVNQSFCAGLLAHVGTLLLIAHDTASFREGMAVLDAGPASLSEIEERRFGASHAQLGAYLLGLWGFSDAIVEAVAFHHRPSQYTKRNIDALTAVHVAQFLARELGGANRQSKSTDGGLDEAYASSAGLHTKLPEWRRICESRSEDWSHE